MRKKTLAGWERAAARQDKIDEHKPFTLDQYIQPMDEVDEALFMRECEIVVPQYLSKTLLQVGEAEDYVFGVYHYRTYQIVGNKHYYLGVLPEFKDNDDG